MNLQNITDLLTRTRADAYRKYWKQAQSYPQEVYLSAVPQEPTDLSDQLRRLFQFSLQGK